MDKDVYVFNLGRLKGTKRSILLKSFTLTIGQKKYEIKDRESAMKCLLLGIVFLPHIVTHYYPEKWIEISVDFYDNRSKASLWDITECELAENVAETNLNKFPAFLYDFKAKEKGIHKGDAPFFIHLSEEQIINTR